MAEPEGGPLEKVLLVDDETNIIKALRRLFLEEPFEILAANSGEEGLSVLRESPEVAVIVTDQRMTGMNGAEFLSKAKELAPDAVRIVLTGYADVGAAVDAINKGGAYRYIAKPWNEEEMVRTVREAAQRFVLVRENRRLSEIVRRQNEELKEWNSRLGQRVLEQTRQMRLQNENLKEFNKRLRGSFEGTLKAFAALFELRDPLERHHSANVSATSVGIALTMGLPEEEIDTIRVASLVHDIGKIASPNLLLLKDPAAMTPEERMAYREHPVRGQTAIDGIESLRPAGVLVRHHHEWWNGAGFPDGLEGSSIPVGARIIGLADFIHREIGRRRGPDAAAAVGESVRRQAGMRIDPGLVTASGMVIAKAVEAAVPEGGVREVELPVKDVTAGMVLSRDVTSGTGILLLPAGTPLDETAVQALRRNLRTDPSWTGIFVVSGEAVP